MRRIQFLWRLRFFYLLTEVISCTGGINKKNFYSFVFVFVISTDYVLSAFLLFRNCI